MTGTTLTDCYWIQSAPCGCITALTPTTEIKGTKVRRLETAEQAHKHMVPLKQSRNYEIRRGFTWSLIPKDSYHSKISKQWECDQHSRS